MIDKVFDCLNSMSATNYGKPERAPYRNVSDKRFEVILKNILFYDYNYWAFPEKVRDVQD